MLFKKSVMTAAVFAVGSFAVMSANAADTGSFNVAMEVQKSCVVESGTNITLAAKADVIAPIGSNIVKVACSVGTPYRILMSPTADVTNEGESKGTLKPADTVANTATLAYQLTTDDTGATPWAAGVKGNETTGGTGTGTTVDGQKSFTVYAKVTGDIHTVKPDTYTDTVNISIDY